MKYFSSRFKVRPLRETYDGISTWFKTPLGRRMLIHERKIIAEELRYLFGYHFMQLSSVKSAHLGSSSRINHCFSLSPTYREDAPAVSGVAEFDDLPFESESLDVVVLHHVLEFSENPHQVLKEAARVTIPRGYVIIVAFNPLSFAGILQGVNALFQRRGVARRKALRVSRMRDWLEFLDFTCTSTRQVFHNLPINNARYLASTKAIDKLCYKTRVPFGMSFVLVARKDKVGLTPLKPNWEKANILGVLPTAKQAIRAQSSKECLVLPFRNKIR